MGTPTGGDGVLAFVGGRRARGRACLRAPAVALSAIGVLGGCMVGPDYRTPDAAVNNDWLESASGPATPAPTRWWETFNDPVLNRLVDEAYAQNLTLRVAGLRVIEARARRGIAVGQFFPQTQQVYAGLRNTQQSANSAFAGDRAYADDEFGIEAAWELDFWGKFRRGIEAADADLLRSVSQYDSVLVTLTAEVATNYILMRSLQERLVYTRQNVELQADTLALTEVRLKAGAVSELDVTTARATLANTQAQIPALEDALRTTKLAMGVLLGRTPSELDEELGASEARLPEAPATIALGVPADLLRRRPDVRAAERLAAAQSALIGVATADLFPSISITGATGFVSSSFETGSGSSDLGDIFSADSFAGFIGLSVRWPVLNYGRIEGNIRVQDARYEQTVAAYQETVLRAAAEVEAGLSSFLRSRERSGYLATAVEAGKRSVELSTIQYRNGAVDFIRLNDAQTRLVEQQDKLVEARAETSLGAVRTFRSLGGGWEVHLGSEYVDEATAQRMRSRTDWGDVLAPGWDQGSDLGFKRPPLTGPSDAAPSTTTDTPK